jgi:hypothetical protein
MRPGWLRATPEEACRRPSRRLADGSEESWSRHPRRQLASATVGSRSRAGLSGAPQRPCRGRVLARGRGFALGHRVRRRRRRRPDRPSHRVRSVRKPAVPAAPVRQGRQADGDGGRRRQQSPRRPPLPRTPDARHGHRT